MKKIAFLVASNNFRDEELFGPMEVLKDFEVEVFSNSNSASGMLGAMINTRDYRKIDLKFDAIIFVGGSGAQIYFEDKFALNLAKTFFENDKVVAAICIAPVILANAGILKGKKCTCFPSVKGLVEKKKGIYLEMPLINEGKIVTCSGPKFAVDFGMRIKELIS